MKRRRHGFTLMEILIALTILMVGLMGVMAIFPLGVRYTAEIGEETLGAVICENVRAAVQLGLHKMKGFKGDKPFFIFMGEGVEGDFPRIFEPSKIKTEWDCYIELPRGELTYMYPRNQDDFVAPAEFDGNPESGMMGEYMVTRTWKVGAEIAQILEDGRGNHPWPRDFDAMIRDPWPRYSYAFTLVRARTDTNKDRKIDESDDLSDHLFELAVFVFRNFPDTPEKAQSEWNKERPSKRMRAVINNGPLRTLIAF
ncbi:MAG: type IV pilus modification PilV family protein [Planctomycetota bacterium]|jgi:hypothetical protein